jgi:NAD(P)H-dependent FMN reductase
LSIIVASTRPGRVGLPVGQWAETAAREHGRFDEIELVDLAEVNLPFLDEPHHPRLARYEHQHTKDWSAKVAASDAFVFVIPEYNHGYNAVLKNALDFLFTEWNHKAAGLVSYGGIAAGTRAAQMVKPVLSALRITPVADAVSIPFVQRFVVDGALVPDDAITGSAKAMFDELAQTTDALRPLRAGA